MELKMAKLNILVLGLKTFGASIVKQLYEYNGHRQRHG